MLRRFSLCGFVFSIFLILPFNDVAQAQNTLPNILRDLDRVIRGPEPTRPRPSIERPPVRENEPVRRADPAIARAKEIQAGLNELGYDAGPVDGRPGRKTRTAISRFQRDQGFEETGDLSGAEIAVLRREVAANIEGPGRRKAQERARAYEVQVYLRELGFDPGRPDGVWGRNSQRALERFRRSQGLPVGDRISDLDFEELHAQVHGVAPNDRAIARRPDRTTDEDGFDDDFGADEPRRDDRTREDRRREDRDRDDRRRDDRDRENRDRDDRDDREFGDDEEDDRRIARNREPVDLPPTSAYVHLFQSGQPQGPKAQFDRLFLLGLGLNPDVLNEQAQLQSIFYARNPPYVDGKPNPVFQEFQSLNEIEQEDALAALRDVLEAEIDKAAPVTAEDAVPVAIYVPVNVGRFERDKGIPLVGRDANGRWNFSVAGLSQVYLLQFDTSHTSHLALDRRDASDWIDTYRGKTLFRVIYGRITTVGRDEEVSDFAATRRDQSQIETTFVIDRITLEERERGSNRRIVIPDSDEDAPEPIYEWTPLSAETEKEPSGEQDAFTLAEELGIPVHDGHVIGHVITNQARENQARAIPGWQKFNMLSVIGDDPDWLKRDKNFVYAAATLLSERDKTRFFGKDNYQVANFVGLSRVSNRTDDPTPFEDQFVLEDARDAFFERYSDRILAQTPRWPMPVLTQFGVKLGKYDRNAGEYEIIYPFLANGQIESARVVGLPAPYRWGGAIGLHAADRFGNLPTRLKISRSEARALLNRVKENGFYLIVFSEFDWSEDGTALEATLAARNAGETSTVRPGRATITRAALFSGADLSDPVLELDPEDITIRPPEPEKEPERTREREPDAPKLSDAERVIQQPLASGDTVYSAIAELLGGDDRDYARLARLNKDVKQANEFDEDDVAAEVEDRMRDAQTETFWISTRLRFGRYRRSEGVFPIEQANQRINFANLNYQAGLQVQVRDNGLQRPVPIPEDVARDLVEKNQRDVEVRLLVRPLAVTDKSQSNYDNFELQVQVVEAIYYRPGRGNERPRILSQVSYEAEIARKAEDAERVFEVSDFAELTEARPYMSTHIRDLLAIRASGEDPEFLIEPLMTATWLSEQYGADLPGPAFFKADAAFPDATTRKIYGKSFASYITAKAEALGTEFRLTMAAANGTRHPCRDAYILGHQGGNFQGAVMEGVDANSVIQEQYADYYQGTEAFRSELSHAGLTGRITGDQQRAYCQGNEQTLIVLNDLTLLPRTLQSKGQLQVVDVTVEDVETFSGRGDFLDIRITVSAGATHLVQIDGEGFPVAPVLASYDWREMERETEAPETGRRVTPDTTRDSAEERDADKPERSRRTRRRSSRSEPRVEEPVKTPDAPVASLSPPATEAPSVWPVIALGDVDLPDQDVIGIRIGDSFEDAEAILKDREVMMAYETVEPPSGGPFANGYRRVYMLGGGEEMISMASWAPDGRIVSITRSVSRYNRTIPFDKVIVALSRKYGEPVWRLPDDKMIGWGTEAASGNCTEMPIQGDQPREVRMLGHMMPGGSTWEDPSMKQMLAQVGVVMPLENNIFLESDGCSFAVQFRKDVFPDGQGSQFQMLMIGLDFARQVQALLGEAADPGLDIDF